MARLMHQSDLFGTHRFIRFLLPVDLLDEVYCQQKKVPRMLKTRHFVDVKLDRCRHQNNYPEWFY